MDIFKLSLDFAFFDVVRCVEGRGCAVPISLTCVVPMSSLAPSFFLLLQTAADSAGTRIVVEHNWLDTMANVGQSLVSVLVVVMLVMGIVLLYALKKSIDELSKLIRSAYEPLRGALGEVREITGEVRTMAKSLKAPVALASETIEEASERVRALMDVAEGRLARLDALVGMAQGEAEGAVIGAASLMRGVKAGGHAVRRSLGLARHDEGVRRRRRQADSDDVEDALPEDEEDTLLDAEEDDAADVEAPRIRPRAATRR